MAQTKLEIKYFSVPREKFGAVTLDAAFSIQRCECGNCRNFVLTLAAREKTSGIRLPVREMILPLSVLDFLVTECMALMANDGRTQ